MKMKMMISTATLTMILTACQVGQGYPGTPQSPVSLPTTSGSNPDLKAFLELDQGTTPVTDMVIGRAFPSIGQVRLVAGDAFPSFAGGASVRIQSTGTADIQRVNIIDALTKKPLHEEVNLEGDNGVEIVLPVKTGETRRFDVVPTQMGAAPGDYLEVSVNLDGQSPVSLGQVRANAPEGLP